MTWISSDQLPAYAVWCGTLIWSLAVFTAAFNAPRASGLGGARGRGYFGGTLLLWMLWQINASVAPGLGYHVLGAALWVLMFGWPLATLSLSAELVVHGMGAAGGLALEFSVRILPAILAPPVLGIHGTGELPVD
ncbi:MAG: hypothetical protein SV583_05560 [Pseudomonadota bacterium]|nr:hypothetical protein [Pseudomonadota bacterium]